MTVKFVSREKIQKLLLNCGHKGEVLSVMPGEEKLSLKLTARSNPRLTARILLANTRAIETLSKMEQYGAYTMLDIPPSYYLRNEKYQYL